MLPAVLKKKKKTLSWATISNIFFLLLSLVIELSVQICFSEKYMNFKNHSMI